MPAREDRVSGALARRCAGLPWEAMAASLDVRGYATTGPFLDAAECGALVELYGDERRFRSRVDMARFRFGEGEYKYFAAPLPEPVATLRQTLYLPLAPVANRWAERLGVRERFPPTPGGWRICAQHGQTRPPAAAPPRWATTARTRILRGRRFLQLTVLLSEPGGPLAATCPVNSGRAQSAAYVAEAARKAVFFITRYRPARHARLEPRELCTG
jgi:hypothetical protein